MAFSVLLSIYQKERPDYLRQCLDSLFQQTLPANEIVLVEDGPLTSELDAVIQDYRQAHPELKTVKLETNGGLGHALNVGLQHCTYDIVARMDTDDICKPNRFEQQVRFMETHPDTDVVGSWIDEFVNSPSDVVSTRKTPEHHDDIWTFGKRRNPMNHPTVMFRRSAVERVGSYRPFYLLEDYDLWIRMFLGGARFHNIQQSLLCFRLSGDFFQRRGGWSYLHSEARLQYFFLRHHYITPWRMLKNITIRATMRVLPSSWRQKIYLHYLRK